MHIYEVLTTPDKVFVDPLLPDVFQKLYTLRLISRFLLKNYSRYNDSKVKNLVSPKKEGYVMTIGTGINESA